MRNFLLVILSLVFTASWLPAQAAEVCLEGDTVIGIKDLTIQTDWYGEITIDVDFRYTTAFELYGPDLLNTPFPPDSPNAEEDAIATILQIDEVLDANSPVPTNAGQPGQTAYFIGVEQETEGDAGLIAVVGAENTTGLYWDPCTRINDCILGAGVKEGDRRHTYAHLVPAAGGSCDSGAPPPPTFTITPGITGSWWDPGRSGEGYNIEIIGSSLEPRMVAYWYTYDASGNQMWLSGNGPVNGDTAVVPVAVTSGPVFGDGYDLNDVVSEDWGTLTFKFSSCTVGSADYASTVGFGSGTINIERLTYVTGLACP